MKSEQKHVMPGEEMPSEDAQSFLIVRLGAIGDVLRTLPAVTRLRQARPKVTIAWAVEQWVYPVLAGNPNIDRFHLLDRRELRAGAARAWNETRRFLGEIRRCRYDVALDFHGRLKSGAVSYFSGAPRRIGYVRGQCTEGNYLFTNERVRLENPLENRVLRFLKLLSPLNIDASYDPRENGLYLCPEVKVRASEWYEKLNCPVLAVYPGSSRRQAAYHRWPKDKWIDLLTRLSSEGVRSVVFWGPDEESLACEIVESAGSGCILAPQTSLPEMAAMLGNFQVFLGSNTAAMHMSWLQGVPTAVFVGPALADTDSPLPPVPFRVLRAGNYFRTGVSKRYQPQVTREVPVEEALQALRELLAEADLSMRRT